MVWDRFIQTFHWSLVAGILLNQWMLEAGETPHEWVGYGLVALVAARVIWGFLGPAEARFAEFVVGPRRALESIRQFGEEHRSHTGHTPLAGWMTVLLLLLILTTSVTGWMQELDTFWGIEWVQTTHEVLADAIIAAAGVHIAAVVLIQRRYRLPLIQSMWRGRA